MKKANFSILLFCIVTLGACDKKVDRVRLSAERRSKYPLIVDYLDVRRQYDMTKWALYSIHCDDTIRFKKETGIQDKLTFASLSLVLDTLLLKGDTIELDFQFLYKNEPCYPWLVDNEVFWGAVYKLDSDSILYYSWGSNARYYWNKDPTSRDRNLMHPAVIKYLNENKGILNPWLKGEAKKRGILR